MKKAEIALAMVLRELQDHIDSAEDRRLKAEKAENSPRYVLAVEACTAFDMARECVLDVAKLMQITLKDEAE